MHTSLFLHHGKMILGSEPFSEEEANVILDELDINKVGMVPQ